MFSIVSEYPLATVSLTVTTRTLATSFSIPPGFVCRMRKGATFENFFEQTVYDQARAVMEKPSEVTPTPWALSELQEFFPPMSQDLENGHTPIEP